MSEDTTKSKHDSPPKHCEKYGTYKVTELYQYQILGEIRHTKLKEVERQEAVDNVQANNAMRALSEGGIDRRAVWVPL